MATKTETPQLKRKKDIGRKDYDIETTVAGESKEKRPFVETRTVDSPESKMQMPRTDTPSYGVGQVTPNVRTSGTSTMGQRPETGSPVDLTTLRQKPGVVPETTGARSNALLPTPGELKLQRVADILKSTTSPSQAIGTGLEAIGGLKGDFRRLQATQEAIMVIDEIMSGMNPSLWENIHADMQEESQKPEWADPNQRLIKMAAAYSIASTVDPKLAPLGKTLMGMPGVIDEIRKSRMEELSMSRKETARAGLPSEQQRMVDLFGQGAAPLFRPQPGIKKLLRNKQSGEIIATELREGEAVPEGYEVFEQGGNIWIGNDPTTGAPVFAKSRGQPEPTAAPYAGGPVSRRQEPIPPAAQEAVLGQLDTLNSLNLIESKLNKSGIIEGLISQAEAYLGAQDAAQFQVASNRLKLSLQTIIKGIPSDKDVALLVSIIPLLTKAEGRNKEILRQLREQTTNDLKIRYSSYKLPGYFWSPLVIQRAKDVGVDLENLPAAFPTGQTKSETETGEIIMVAPDGNMGTVPASEVPRLEKSGYKRAQ